MAKYRMKFFGSAVGKSGRNYQFDKGQIIEAVKGEFPEEYAELIDEGKRESAVKGAETAAKSTPGEKRNKRK